MFTITIETENAAFRNPHTGEEDIYSREMELSRIIETQVLPHLENGTTNKYLHDSNGNRVGRMEVK